MSSRRQAEPSASDLASGPTRAEISPCAEFRGRLKPVAAGAYRRIVMKRLIAGALSSAIVMGAGTAGAQDLKLALIYSKTGPLDAYAKPTDHGLMVCLDYLTQGAH